MVLGFLRYIYVLSATFSCFIPTDSAYVNPNTLLIFSFGLLIYYFQGLSCNGILVHFSLIGAAISAMLFISSLMMWKGIFQIKIDLDSLSVLLVCKLHEWQISPFFLFFIGIFIIFITLEIIVNVYKNSPKREVLEK